MTTRIDLPDISAHPAVRNSFFSQIDRGLAGSRRPAVLRGYYAFTRAFPPILASLLARCDDERTQFYLTQILYSELGSGKLGRAHARLFAEMSATYGVVVDDAPQPPESGSARLISTLARLYGAEPLSVALGAQTALELQAGLMLQKLAGGFADASGAKHEFFVVHEEDEPEHERSMLECLEIGVDDPAAFRRGFDECMDAFALFWSDLARECGL